LLSLAACGETNPPGSTYFERNIQPILTQFCAGNVAGCHKVNDDDPYQFAAGNLDVSSFERIQKRRDVLKPFGPYPVPLLLIKAVGQTDELGFNYEGKYHPLKIQHAGGPVMQVGSDAYLTLLTWTENGATENGLPPPVPPREGVGACSTSVPDEFDPTPIQANAQFANFKNNVQPILDNCNSGNCHGTPQADFYITCGDDDKQAAFNFSQAQSFVDDPVDNSELLQVPLAVSSGGYAHTGGDRFTSRTASNYVTVRDWAEAVGRLSFGEGDPEKTFFADNIEPLLIERGCAFEACHSPDATNDFKLRSGSQDFFSAIALQRNYDLLKQEFLAFEVPDVRRGRAVAKTILPKFGGIPHRGGPVLETPGSGGSVPASCPATYDPATASAYCTFQQWENLDRAKLISDGEVDPLGQGDTVPIVYVDRLATHVATPLEFDTYQPDSDLMVANATIGAEGALSGAVAGTSILGNCPGASDRSVVDVRGPSVNLDGNRVAFAMRTSASEGLSIYTVDLDGSNCTRVTGPSPDVNGIKIHDFDPSWAPDGAWIVFASTRGAQGNGPSLSRKLFLPQSDIWRMHPDGSGAEPMTFLTNSEINPQWMRNGEVTMTTEKVSQGFYQLSGRRINWDRTDYHPLLAQRKESPYADPADLSAMRPSIGYQQATEVRESSDGDFLIILSDAGAKGGAGTLGIFSRSVGPFEADRQDPGFLKSLTIVDPSATGRVGSNTNGAYRNPFPLLDRRIMVSYAAYTGDLGNATSLDWDIVAIDPRTGNRTTLIGGAGAQVDAVLALKHPARPYFVNKRQLVFGGKADPDLAAKNQAYIHFPDAPAVFTLVNANLRRGRPIALFDSATQLAVYRENPPPPGTTTGNTPDGIYESRDLLGRAPLAKDGSVRIVAPAGTGLILELEDSQGNPVVTMKEEHQVGPGEEISLGIRRELFDAVCGGCHGSVSGSELDIAVTPDALTGASESLSAKESPKTLGN